jgi:quinol monooxygenase YgiN
MILIIEKRDMITVLIVVKLRPEKQEEFLQTIHSLNGDSEKYKGLKKFTSSQEINDQNGFSLTYEWETQEDLDRFSDLEEFKVLLGALRVLCEKSEIRYNPFGRR